MSLLRGGSGLVGFEIFITEGIEAEMDEEENQNWRQLWPSRWLQENQN